MATLSTHVLDTSVGRPAAGIRVALESASGADLGEGVTDADGRIPTFAPERLGAGDYRLRFDTAAYFLQLGVTGVLPGGGRDLHGRGRRPLPRPAAAQPVRLLHLPRQLRWPDVLFRAGRAVVAGEGSARERTACATVWWSPSRPSDAPADAAEVVDARRRRGAAARPRRHARARQRARPDRVGGLRDRHPGGRRRRRDDDRRHAAQRPAADDDGGRTGERSRPSRATRPGSTSASGAGRCRATSTTSPRCTPAGRVRLQVLPAPLGRRRVPATRRRATSRRRWRETAAARRADDRARRGRRHDRATPRRSGRRTPASSTRRPRGAEDLGDRTGHRRRPAPPVGGRTCCTSAPPARLPRSRAARADGVRRDVWRPARTTSPSTAEDDRPTAPPSSSAARRSARRTTATLLWAGASSTATSTWS